MDNQLHRSYCSPALLLQQLTHILYTVAAREAATRLGQGGNPDRANKRTYYGDASIVRERRR